MTSISEADAERMKQHIYRMLCGLQQALQEAIQVASIFEHSAAEAPSVLPTPTMADDPLADRYWPGRPRIDGVARD